MKTESQGLPPQYFLDGSPLIALASVILPLMSDDSPGSISISSAKGYPVYVSYSSSSAVSGSSHSSPPPPAARVPPKLPLPVSDRRSCGREAAVCCAAKDLADAVAASASALACNICRPAKPSVPSCNSKVKGQVRGQVWGGGRSGGVGEEGALGEVAW